jgi:hypothetical protein
MAAVRGLEKEFAGRVDFAYLPASGEEGQAALARNGWAKAKHGLEAVATDGHVTGHLPGHNFGEPEIRGQIETLLRAGAK